MFTREPTFQTAYRIAQLPADEHAKAFAVMLQVFAEADERRRRTRLLTVLHARVAQPYLRTTTHCANSVRRGHADRHLTHPLISGRILG
jgi:hypothetical protein